MQIGHPGTRLRHAWTCQKITGHVGKRHMPQAAKDDFSSPTQPKDFQRAVRGLKSIWRFAGYGAIIAPCYGDSRSYLP